MSIQRIYCDKIETNLDCYSSQKFKSGYSQDLLSPATMVLRTDDTSQGIKMTNQFNVMIYLINGTVTVLNKLI